LLRLHPGTRGQRDNNCDYQGKFPHYIQMENPQQSPGAVQAAGSVNKLQL